MAKDLLNEFVASIRSAYVQNLRSIVLYGSKAVGDETRTGSDYNLVVILEKADPRPLGALGPALPRWVKAGNLPPVIFSREMFHCSADVFPMEYHDMKEGRRVLYGEDPFEGLEISDAHLRHQCEYELKSKLLELRREYLVFSARPNEKELRLLMINSISSVLTVFRHTIRLFGKTPPLKKSAALSVFTPLTGIDAVPFLVILQLKDGDRAAGKREMGPLMEQYLRALEKAAAAIDRL
jgi:hypothetical protein